MAKRQMQSTAKGWKLLRELEAQARNQNNVVISTNDSSQNQNIANITNQNGPGNTQNNDKELNNALN